MAKVKQTYTSDGGNSKPKTQNTKATTKVVNNTQPYGSNYGGASTVKTNTNTYGSNYGGVSSNKINAPKPATTASKTQTSVSKATKSVSNTNKTTSGTYGSNYGGVSQPTKKNDAYGSNYGGGTTNKLNLDNQNNKKKENPYQKDIDALDSEIKNLEQAYNVKMSGEIQDTSFLGEYDKFNAQELEDMWASADRERKALSRITDTDDALNKQLKDSNKDAVYKESDIFDYTDGQVNLKDFTNDLNYLNNEISNLEKQLDTVSKSSQVYGSQYGGQQNVDNEETRRINQQLKTLREQKDELAKKQQYQNAYMGRLAFDQAVQNRDVEALTQLNSQFGSYNDNPLERTAKATAQIPVNLYATALSTIDIVRDFAGDQAGKKLEQYANFYHENGQISDEKFNAFLEIAKQVSDFEADDPNNYSSQMRQLANQLSYETMNGLNGVERFVAEGLTSTANFFTQFYLMGPTGSLVSMGVQSASQKYFENLERGYDKNVALANAVATGLISYATEKIGMDRFVSILNGTAGKGAVAQLVNQIKQGNGNLAIIMDNIISQGMAEGLEEMAEGNADFVLDFYTSKFTNGEPVEYSAGDLFYATLVGAFSGGITGAMGSANTYNLTVQTREQYNQLRNDVNSLMQMRSEAVLNNEDVSSLDKAIKIGTMALNNFESKSPVSMAVETPQDKVDTNLTPEGVVGETTEILQPNIDQAVSTTLTQEQLENNVYNMAQEFMSYNNINEDAREFINLSEQSRQNVIDNSKFATRLGINVGFSQLVEGDGFFDPQTKTIMISPNSTRGEVSTLVHELTHFNENSSYYKTLSQLAEESYGDNAKGRIQEIKNLYKNFFERTGISSASLVDDAYAQKEFTAIETQDQLGNEEYVQKLIRYNESLAYRIFDNIRAMTSSDVKTKLENTFAKAFRDAQNMQNAQELALHYSVGEQAQIHKDRALEEYGTTNDYKKAGYILDDGRYLDFSGGGPTRGDDHRAIASVFDGSDMNGTRSMIAFMNEGNIRMQPESNGIDISDVNEPTTQQYNSLYDYFDMLRDTGFRIDMSNEEGRNVFSIEYPPNTSPRKAINDIKQYFEDGTVPEVSNLSNYFHYSFGESNDKNADTDSDGEKLPENIIERFKGTKLTDDQGRLLRIYHTSRDLFTNFDPRESSYYRFGDKIVNFFSTNEEVSGSYTSDDYKQVKKADDFDKIKANEEELDSIRDELYRAESGLMSTKAYERNKIQDFLYSGKFENAILDTHKNLLNYRWNNTGGPDGSVFNNLLKEYLVRPIVDNFIDINYDGDGPSIEYIVPNEDPYELLSGIAEVLTTLDEGEYRNVKLSENVLRQFWPLREISKQIFDLKDTFDENLTFAEERFKEVEDRYYELQNETKGGNQYVGYGKSLNPYILENGSGYMDGGYDKVANWNELNDMLVAFPKKDFTLSKSSAETTKLVKLAENIISRHLTKPMSFDMIARTILRDVSEKHRNFLTKNPIALANLVNIMKKLGENPGEITRTGIYHTNENGEYVDDVANAKERKALLVDYFNRHIADGDWTKKSFVFRSGVEVQTNDVVKAVLAINDFIDTPYDGVIFRGITDSASLYAQHIPSDIIALFDSNQFKLIGNENPTDNPDIRFSAGLTNDEQNNNVKRENTNDFKLLQSESERIANTTSWGDKSRVADEKLQQRLSQVFRMELESRDYSPSNADGLLKDTGDYKIYKDVDGQTFHDIFSVARTYLNKGELVDLHPVDTTEHDGWTETGYNDTRNFLSDDGLSGFAITKDGDLISVFNLSDKGGFLRSIAPFIRENVKTLDCYVLPDSVSKTNLQDIYNKAFGFETYKIEDYNWDYDHDGIGDRYQEPQIAYMINPNYPGDTQSQTGDTQTSVQDGEQRQQRFPENLDKSLVLNEKQKDSLRERVANGEFTYTGLNNQEEVNKARDNMFNVGVDEYFKDYMNNNSPSAKTVVQGEVLLTELAKNNDSRWEQVSSKLADDATIAGQFLQAYAIMQRLTPEGQLVAIRRNLNRMQRDIDNRFGNKAPKLNVNEDLMNDLKNAKTIEEAMEVREKIYEDLENQIPKTVRDVINSWRYLSMLGNPRTHIRNIVGNGIFAPAIDIKNVIGTGLEKIFENKLEYKTKAILNPSTDKALLDSGYQAYEDYRGALEQGQKYETKSFNDDTKLGRIMNKLSDFNSQALDKEDFFFSKHRYATSYAQFLKANNLTADTLSDDMKKRANEYALLEAQKATYRDANSVAERLNELEKSSKKGLRMASYVKDAIIPFTKTPMNIVKRGVEYSPVGLLKTIVYDSKQLADGKITANQYIDNMASGLTGTGIALLGALLTSMGLFRTKDEDEDRKQYFDREKGEQDYAIDLSPFGINGTYTIDWASPVIMPFAIGSELFNVFKDFEGTENFGGVISAVADVSAKIIDPIMETSMLSSLKDTLTSYKRSLGEWVSDIIWAMTSSYISQMVPTIGGQIARTIDDTRRTTSPNNGKIDKLIRQIYNKIPWMSQLNQPYINRQGKEEKTEDLGMGWLGRAVLNMVSPGYYSSKDIDEYDEELYRLHESTGSYDALPSSTTKQLEFEGEKYKFTPEQYTQWHQTRWQTEAEYVNQFIDSSAYENLTDEERVDTIKDIRSYAQKVAKKEFLESQGYEYTDDKELAETNDKYVYDKQLSGAQGAVDNDIELYAYFDYLNNSGSKQAEKMKYLEESGMSQKQKEYLWSLNDYKKSYEDVYKKVFGSESNSSSKKKKSSKRSKKASSGKSGKKKKVKTSGTGGGRKLSKAGKVSPDLPQRVEPKTQTESKKVASDFIKAYSSSMNSSRKTSTGGSSSTVVCPKCGNKVSSAMGRCPICGTRL